MSAGKLRDLITFQRCATGGDGHGNVVTGPWSDIEVSPGEPLTVWADVLERLGGERLAAGALEATRLATIRVRRSDEILTVTEADRIVARGRNWNIRAIAEVGRARKFIEFTAEAGTVT